MAFRAWRVDPEKFINSSLYKLILSRIMASMGAARRKFGVTRYVAEQDPPVSAQYLRAPLAGLFFLVRALCGSGASALGRVAALESAHVTGIGMG